MDFSDAFRNEVRAEHSDAFQLAHDVSRAVGDAVIRPVIIDGEIGRALDMLMQQGWRAHLSVQALAERRLTEDAATISRRLLELAIHAGYIASIDEYAIRLDRARRFLARFWQSAPQSLKDTMPPEDRGAWESWVEDWKLQLPEKPKSWWPSFREMLTSLGHEETYENDYRFLSGVAHGSGLFLARDYARSHADTHYQMDVCPLLIHSSKYYLALAINWNSVFDMLSAEILSELIRRIEVLRTTRGITHRCK
jgi:hypothetical protein